MYFDKGIFISIHITYSENIDSMIIQISNKNMLSMNLYFYFLYWVGLDYVFFLEVR